MKFRSDKGLKAMEKTSRALSRFLKLNFVSDLSTFYDITPRKTVTPLYVPTKDMLDYILVRLQGVLQLLCRIGDSSRTAVIYLESKIRIAHFWKVAFICLSMISRIWVLIKNLLQFGCKFYDTLLKYSVQMGHIMNAQWLPNDYVFPKDIKLWLNIDWLDKSSAVREINVFQIPVLKTAQYDHEELCISDEDDTVFVSDSEDNNNKLCFENNLSFSNASKAKSLNSEDNNNENTGVKQLKKKPKCALSKNNQQNNKPQAYIINSINTLIEIKKFIRKENFARTNKESDVVLNNLDRLQWKILKKKLIKLVKKCQRLHNTEDDRCLHLAKELLLQSIV